MSLLNRSLLPLVAMLMFATIISGCADYGEKMEFNKGEVYYTEGVDPADVQKLGEYLVESEYFDGEKKSVQLQMNGDRYVVRAVVQDEFLEDEKIIAAFEMMGLLFSGQVFNGAPVDVELTDAYLETKTTLPFDQAMADETGVGAPRVVYNKGEVYYSDGVDITVAKRLGQYFAESGYFDGESKSVQLRKKGDVYRLRFVVDEKFVGKEETTNLFQPYGLLVSSTVLNNAPVDVELTDEYFRTLETIPYTQVATIE